MGASKVAARVEVVAARAAVQAAASRAAPAAAPVWDQTAAARVEPVDWAGQAAAATCTQRCCSERESRVRGSMRGAQPDPRVCLCSLRPRCVQ